jgi:dihydroorotate dehydrogenase (fumarate)
MLKLPALMVRLGTLVLALSFSAGAVSGPIAATASPAVYQVESSTDGVAANPATDGRVDKDRSNFDYEVNPNQPAEDSIYVINTGSTSQEVTLYARDAFTDDKGEFLVQGEEALPQDVGAWVEFYNKKASYTRTLKPNEFMTIPFTVKTPSNATPGDHIGAIVASAMTKGTTVNIVRRVAVRLYAHVSGQVKAHLTISNLSVTTNVSLWNPFESSQTLTYDITNDGNIELAADVSAQAKGPLGITFGEPETVRITELLPGSKRTVEQTIAGPAQLFVADTTLISTGLFTRANAAAQQPRLRADFTSFALPAGWLLYISVASVLAAAWWLIGRRKKSRRVAERPDEASL